MKPFYTTSRYFDFHNSIQILNKAINLGNRSKKVLSNYVVLLCKLNRKEEAQTYLDELNEKHGDDPLVINNNIVILAINSGDKDIIRKNFQLLHDKNIDNPSVLYNEGVFEFHDVISLNKMH